jgi:hypothetical protein
MPDANDNGAQPGSGPFRMLAMLILPIRRMNTGIATSVPFGFRRHAQATPTPTCLPEVRNEPVRDSERLHKDR